MASKDIATVCVSHTTYTTYWSSTTRSAASGAASAHTIAASSSAAPPELPPTELATPDGEAADEGPGSGDANMATDDREIDGCADAVTMEEGGGARKGRRRGGRRDCDGRLASHSLGQQDNENGGAVLHVWYRKYWAKVRCSFIVSLELTGIQ
jgi:hypothetical protein